MISGMGLESAALYCNTGDAYFKDGNIPMAILYYERALKLDPSYEDARYNLELLNNIIQDRIDPVPDFILKVWAKDICYVMDSDAWAVCFLVLLALTLALALLFILGATAAGRRTGFFTGIVTLLLAIASLSFSLWQKNDYMSADDAIVMRPVTSVKSSPSAEASTDLFILHEGTKVRILDTVGNWNNVELADGRQGWILSKDIEII
jgi:tetratricopeptide (TPR) repeat protein